MGSRGVRRHLYRAIAQMVERRRPRLASMAALDLELSADEVGVELEVVVAELYRRGSVRNPRQLDLVGWVQAASEEEADGGDGGELSRQLDLFHVAAQPLRRS